MEESVSRRSFLKASAAGPLLLGAATELSAKSASGKRGWKKALIVGRPAENALAPVKKAGFSGVETRAADLPPDQAAQCRRDADRMDMEIHSVMRGWMNFNSRKKEQVEKSIEKVKASLRAAQGFGAGAVLLVPCRIGGMKMPAPWEFDIEFDRGTGHVEKVVAGDNSPYRDYIEAQNYATDSSREAIKRLIPVAEECGVIIAVENVWNNLWVKPEIFRHFVASFDSKWVQAYFDIGNHVKYAPPQDFIRALGPLIVRCHVKDFKLNPDGHGGKFVDIRDGSVDWPVVMKALDKVGYHGWMTIEGSGGLSAGEKFRRLDLIMAGK